MKHSTSLLSVIMLILGAEGHGRNLAGKSGCPFAHGTAEVGPVDFDAVRADLRALFTNSQAFWPADFGNYAPLFIRLAWHCAGSYRKSDGRGGCDGGRIRFDPERSWPDNTNLDKANRLLQAVKVKYGSSLSWGDLIVLTGNEAIASMGGPIYGFCAGRQDDADGSDSLELGPSPEQDAIAPCPFQGDCKAPLGPTTVGLIYVNPEGPMGVPNPSKSAPQIREVFGRMGMNDSETVALVGGGHAFGKAHGACPTGPGLAPNEAPDNPYPGTCGTGAMKGKGPNTFTSGFEGSWTDEPTVWSNDYFLNLLEYDFVLTKSPAGKNQWKPVAKEGGEEPADIFMLTADVALLKDEKYLALVKKYGSDIGALNNAFSHAWYKLTHGDMGPVTRCLAGKGAPIPKPDAFQYPLPPTPATLANFKSVGSAVVATMTTDHSAHLAPDMINGKPYYGAWFAQIAYLSASTFRKTDYKGGANGARIRFSPQKDWDVSFGMDKVLDVLNTVKRKFTSGGALSYADLIVLAGTAATEAAGTEKLPFCGGRVDAADGAGSEFLAPVTYDEQDILNVILWVRNGADISGLTAREYVVLHARLRSPLYQHRMGYSGSWNTPDPSVLSNAYFKLLLEKDWVKQTSVKGKVEYKVPGEKLYMTPQDMAVKYDAEYKAIAQEYAADDCLFQKEFAAAWTKIMNADRFDGPVKNLCDK